MSYYMFYLTVPEFIFILMTYCKVLYRSPKKIVVTQLFPAVTLHQCLHLSKIIKACEISGPVKSLRRKEVLALRQSCRKEVLAVKLF